MSIIGTLDAVPDSFPANGTEEFLSYSGETKTAFFDQIYDGKSRLEYFRDRMGNDPKKLALTSVVYSLRIREIVGMLTLELT